MKNIINLLKDKTKNIRKIFPITFVFIIILTVFLTLSFDGDVFDSEVFDNVGLFLILFISGTIFSESYFSNKKRIISYGVFMILSLIMVILKIEKVTISYFLIINILNFYRFYLNSKVSLSEYLIKVFTNSLKTSILYWVLSIGGILISSVFAYLISDDYEIIWRFLLLLTGLFYIPNLLLDFNNMKIEVSKFTKVLVKYVLETLVIMAFLIIYLYIFKIIITWDIPSNEIFRILSMLFIIGLPIWTMNDYFKDKDFLNKINNILPFAFIPFIILQVYAVFVRIINNGLTITRYLGIILVMLEVIYVILYIFKRKKIDLMFIITSVYVIISFLIPGINMDDLSNRSQVSMIKKYISSDNNIDKKKVISAYEYLRNSDGGEEYLNKYLVKEIPLIKEFMNNNVYERFRYINEELSNISYNISDYHNLKDIEFYEYYNKKIDDINIYIEGIDIINLIKEYLNIYSSGELDDYFRMNHEIVFDTKKIIIKKITISYDSEEKILDYCKIEGFLLEK